MHYLYTAWLYLLTLFNVHTKHPLLKTWVLDIDPRWLSTLMSALRGCDTIDAHSDKRKYVTKMIRYLVTNDVGKKSDYMSNYVVRHHDIIRTLTTSYPNNQHWVEHIIAAGRVISNNHPDPYVREYWNNVYRIISKFMKQYKKEEEIKIARDKYIDSIIRTYTRIYMIQGV